MSLPSDVEPYVQYFETLTRDNTGDLRALAAPDMRFVDPFNDVAGVDRVIRVLAATFDHLDAPRFVVTDRAASGRTWYLRWVFTASRKGQPVRIEGMSEVRFDGEGRVAAHIDHWDSGTQFYARLPLLGAVVRWIRARLSVG